MVETITKVKKGFASQLLHETGHDPSAEEIADKLEMPAERVREIMRIAQDPVSLETPIGEEEDSHLGDFIPDDDAPAPADAASLMLLKEQLNEVLSTLTDREAKSSAAAFRSGGRSFPHTGRSGQGIRCHPRAYSPDRSKGSAETASPQPQQEGQGFLGLKETLHKACLTALHEICLQTFGHNFVADKGKIRR